MFIIYTLMSDIQAGGHAWRQGDWLIHNEAGPVRRGLFGSAILQLSDFLSLSSLVTLCLLQSLLVGIAFLSFRTLAYLTDKPALTVLILMSPGIFTLFWVADPNGAVRKEVFAYAGLSLIAIGALRKSYLSLWMGAILLSVGFIAHEALLVFAPTYLAIFWFNRHQKLSAFHTVGASLLLLGTALFVVVYTLFYTGPVDAQLKCQILLDRQFNPDICSGALDWIGRDLSYAFEKLTLRLKPRGIIGYIIGYAVSLMPFLYLIIKISKAREAVVLLLLSAAPFLLLNVVALDWGRWISLHIFSVCILATCAVYSGRIAQNGPISANVLAGFGLLSLLISPAHIIGLRLGGALRSVAAAWF